MTDDPHDAALTFHVVGKQIVALGRGLTFGRALVELGRQLGKVTAAQMAGSNLVMLRQPLDQLREAVDALAVAEQTLRALLDGLAVIVGVDN